VVISRDNLRDTEVVKRKQPFRTLIIDELSGYKSNSSVRYKTARKLIARDRISHVWGLTGTPSPNGLIDLWPQIALLDNGERLGKNITTFRNRYFTPGRTVPPGIVVSWDPRPEADERIREKLEDICISMETEGRVKLPGITHNPISVELPARARKAYDDIRASLVADLTDIFGGEIHTAGNAAILTAKLSQIAAGFLYVDDADIRGSQYVHLHDEKVKAVQEVIENQSSPILLFYRFQAELERLKAEFPESRTMDERNVLTDWDRGNVPILLAHPASAGHGLNLQRGGHTAVWTSLPWSLEEWEQANKRLFRQGQQHPVVIHMIMANKTVDHLILKRLMDKADVQDSLLEYLRSPI
jgi:SNF2 family DNA or RNA helicase